VVVSQANHQCGDGPEFTGRFILDDVEMPMKEYRSDVVVERVLTQTGGSIANTESSKFPSE
jgi:hypothetical protein